MVKSLAMIMPFVHSVVLTNSGSSAALGNARKEPFVLSRESNERVTDLLFSLLLNPSLSISWQCCVVFLVKRR